MLRRRSSRCVHPTSGWVACVRDLCSLPRAEDAPGRVWLRSLLIFFVCVCRRRCRTGAISRIWHATRKSPCTFECTCGSLRKPDTPQATTSIGARAELKEQQRQLMVGTRQARKKRSPQWPLWLFWHHSPQSGETRRLPACAQDSGHCLPQLQNELRPRCKLLFHITTY